MFKSSTHALAGTLTAGFGAGFLLLMGCTPGDANSEATPPPELVELREQSEEMEKLERLAADLPALRRDHEEVVRLRKQAEEIEQLQAENAQLEKQIAAVRTQRAEAAAAARAKAFEEQASALKRETASGVQIIVHGQDQEAAGDPNAMEVIEGDQILVDPQLLGILIPGIDPSNIQRSEPVVVNQLLEDRGITLTNYAQLVEMGLTNFVVRRNPPTEENLPAQQP